MSELPVMSALFEHAKLVSRKAELVKKYAERYTLICRSDSSRDLSLHIRDRHSGHFNIEYDLQNQRRQEGELAEIRAEYDEVCEKISDLEHEIEIATALPSTA